MLDTTHYPCAEPPEGFPPLGESPECQGLTQIAFKLLGAAVLNPHPEQNLKGMGRLTAAGPDLSFLAPKAS